MIGGAAIATVARQSVIMPTGLQPDDLLILTKPLGTQLAVNAFQWLRNHSQQYSLIQHILSPPQIEQAFRQAVMSMATLNLQASRLMHEYKAHGATDITGFGLKGHA
jgi:selenide,water dikinase